MEINKATHIDRESIVFLLQSNSLPADDLPPVLDGFYSAHYEGVLVGLIGLEHYDRFGLLRSMVVHPEYRNLGIAERLVNTLEQHAAKANIEAIYLLTETAAGYFSRKGYTKVDRADVPAAVKTSSEFSHVCPVSATVMVKGIAH